MGFETLKKRKDFLWVRGGRRWATASLVLEGRRKPGKADNAMRREDNTDSLPGKSLLEKNPGIAEDEPRFGFTVTRRVGNAVIRNRIKRRLRETVRQVAPHCAKPGYDYVLVGRRAALDRSFADMLRDLEIAFPKVHGLSKKA